MGFPAVFSWWRGFLYFCTTFCFGVFIVNLSMVLIMKYTNRNYGHKWYRLEKLKSLYRKRTRSPRLSSPVRGIISSPSESAGPTAQASLLGWNEKFLSSHFRELIFENIKIFTKILAYKKYTQFAEWFSQKLWTISWKLKEIISFTKTEKFFWFQHFNITRILCLKIKSRRP